MRGKLIKVCGECANYDWKRHRCKLGCNEGEPQEPFYSDCPLPTVDTDPKWISVSERFPEKEGYYITFTLCSNNSVIPLKFVFTTVRGQKVKRWEWNGRISPWVVTHWMPLPEPPKVV